MSAATATPAPTWRIRRTTQIITPLATILALLLVWELLVRVGVLPMRYAPPPTVIVQELGAMLIDTGVYSQLGGTLVGWGSSLGIAVVLGVVFGTLLGRFRAASAFFSPIVEFLRPIPSVAMIPLAVLLSGSGKPTEIFLATYAALWQMLVAAMVAVGSVDPVARDTAASFGLSRSAQTRHVLLPSMLPHLVTGIRIASATALIFCITSELLIGSPGLGQGLGAARSVGNLPRMYAFIVVIGIVGFLLNAAFKWVESKVLFWHESQRGGTQ